MSKIYFVDSENVGDGWIDLFKEDMDSDFLVFYTGHSPRIDYEHVIFLMNVIKKPEFIRCYEGSNALDFQLVSYLGFYSRSEEEKEYIIVSNDTGFDAVVFFWKERGLNIKRHATNLVQPSETMKNELPVSSDDKAVHQTVEVNTRVQGVDKKELHTVINCIGASNQSGIHLAYTHFYGNNKGEALYKLMKAEDFSAPYVVWKKETRIKKIIELIFKYCNSSKTSIPNDINAYLCSSIGPNDDAKSMLKKLTKKYGEKLAVPINKILKPFYKTIAKIQ